MSFESNQIGAQAHNPVTRVRSEAVPADKSSQNGHPVHNVNGNGHVNVNGNGNAAGVNGVGAAQATTTPLRNGALARTVAAANETVGDLIDLTRRLRFEVDQDSGAVTVLIVDADSGEPLRQIPGDEFLELHERLDEFRILLIDDVG